MDQSKKYYFSNDGLSLPEGSEHKTEALRYDDTKPPIDLVTPEFIEGLAKVLGFGAEKYDRDNWRKGMDLSRCYASAQRHLLAFWKGEDNDEESGLPHLYHAGVNLMFMDHYMRNKPELDNRFKE